MDEADGEGDGGCLDRDDPPPSLLRRGFVFVRGRRFYRVSGDKVGFLEKYPFLVTGLFFFMCFVSVIHLFVGVVYCLASWFVNLPKRPPIDANILKLLIPVAVRHALGHVTSNVSFAAIAVSFTHTIKALAFLQCRGFTIHTWTTDTSDFMAVFGSIRSCPTLSTWEHTITVLM